MTSPNWQPYLNAIARHYAEWWKRHMLTEAISARQTTFTFEQTVQTEEQCQEEPSKKRTVSLPLLQGILQYAKLGHVLLVGAPGAGKSTTLLRLLVDIARQELQKPEPRIPVLVKLKDYKEPTSGSEDHSGMLALIREALEPEMTLTISEVKTLLFTKKCLFLLLDGLNEIPTGVVYSKLVEFLEKCDRAKISLICTTRDLGDNLGIKRRLELQSLNPSEIQRFLDGCMARQKQKVLQLLKQGNSELGKTPFVLWMLYDVFQNTGEVPESLGEAFRRFTQAFVIYKTNQEGTPVSEQTIQHWKLLLQYLAFEMLRSPEPQNPGLLISETQATSILTRFPNQEPIDVLQASLLLKNLLKYHLLQKSHRGEISFCHQLLQEYYAAEWMLYQLPVFLQDERSQKKFKRDYLNYLKWTEAIAMMLALVDDEGQALRVVDVALNDIDLLLGARLAGEVKPAFQNKTVSRVAALKIPELLKIKFLERTRSDEALPVLLKAIEDPHFDVCWIAIEALQKLGSEEAIPVLLKTLEAPILLEDPDSVRRVVAAFRMSKVKMIPGLIRASEDSESDTHLSGAVASARMGSVEAALVLLEALEAPDFLVRERAVEALGKLSSPSQLATLWQARLKHPADEDLRDAIAAIQARCKFYNYEIASGIIPAGQSIEVFFSYAPNDQDLRDKLERHLSLLKRQGIITSLHNQKILPGTERAQAINHYLNTATIILLLISANSLASDHCYDIEIRRSLERHHAGEARVIPILLRPVDYQNANFSQLPMLPANGKFVTQWENPDEAFEAIAQGIRNVAMEIRCRA